jgi:hypothetical protein
MNQCLKADWNRVSRRTSFSVVFAFLVLAAIPSGSLRAGEEIRSGWWSGEAAIDGTLTPWDGVMAEPENWNLFIGVVNDGEYLYLCLKSPDPRVLRQAMMRGLTVRIEPKKGEPFSIQYPIGVHQGSRMAPPGGGGPEGDGTGGGENGSPADREKLWEAARDSLDTFLLADFTSREPVRFAAENGFGIRLYISPPGEAFLYQAKIPLRPSQAHPHALGADPGSRLTLVVETPERSREGMSAGPGGGAHGGYHGGGGGGGWGGHGGGMHGGGGGHHGPDSGERPGMEPPLKLKVKLQLAVPGDKKPAAGPASQ